MKRTMIGDKGTGEPIVSALNFQEHQDSSWLNIDYFPDNSSIEDKSGFGGAKDGQAENGLQKMGHNLDWDKDGPRDGNREKHSRGDVIADPEMDGIGVDGGGSYGKDDPRVGVSGDAEGEQSSSDAQAFQALVYPSPHVARRGRSRPRRSRPAITVKNAIWEVTKIAGDEQSSVGRLFKV
ncbi:uncharacterized protein KY384_003240 [Bacidia gigantensis]|uniref:uncharacterized protein n=1 Tax=Bacidia gigantensis TaxID=2732470 RepID=UPI001D052F56|nr:uncharacterized protein KY384_003240 [Bacidia gigantensis]KAG8531609.1 hypothetical protein KY384_003240 [Bacidia gigantensis]